MAMTPLYTATASAVAGRAGKVNSTDNKLNFNLSVPKELGGDSGPGTNPEQLFAAGYAACFGGALLMVAKQQKISPSSVTITAHVTIGKENEGYKLAVHLEGNMPGISAKDAGLLMEKAHQVCPYSKATRGNIEVKLSVKSV